MKFYVFLDETGDHGLSFIDKNFPLFLLCGCIIKDTDLITIEKNIDYFKRKYFKSTGVILHSRDIRKCEGAFQILFDLNVKSSFYRDLNSIIEESTFCLIGSGIHKEKYIKKYGKGAKNPYSLSFSFIIERMIFYLDSVSKDADIEILAEERGIKEDRMLLSYFNSIIDRGTYYVEPERLKRKITKFSFRNKRDNVIGLQMADLCAYPLARHILYPKEPYIPFDVIKDKIYCDKRGKYSGLGLKLFP